MTRTDPIDIALEAIRATGPLTPSRVVEAAEDPASPLHDSFQWDDGTAAHQYRLWQARRLLAVRVIRLPSSPRVVRAYINAPPRSGHGEGEYVPTRVLVRQPGKLALARDAILRDLAAAQQSLDDLDAAIAAFGPTTRRAAATRKRSKAARAHVAAAQAAIQPVV